MKINVWLIWVFIVCLSIGHAQNATSMQTFKPLQSEGEFPAFLNDVLAASPQDNIYNGFLKNRISEGKILYGTELNHYIDHIAEQLLAQYPDLQKEVHVYIYEVPEVNAYSLKNGAILINMGMLAQITNEAELAYILAHEIAHYSEHHGTISQNPKTKSKNFLSEYFQTHQYSRDQEFAADRVGLTQFFKNSPYSFEVLDGIYDVLLYANLPFDEIPFEKSEVETDFYSFPEDYFLKTVASITNRSTVVDTFLTHPNIEKRRSAAKALASTFSNDNRKKFVQPEEEFFRVRDLARFSCVEYYLVRHQYDRAIYNIHVLQKLFPDNEYLERSMASAFYGASRHKSEGTISSTYKPYKEVEGEMQQVNHLMFKMNRQEYSLLALRKAWSFQQKHPEDSYIKDIVKDLIHDIFVTQKKTFVDFCDYPQGTNLEDITEEETTANTGNSKYDRIKQQTATGKVLPEAKFKTANYMLVDIHQDSLFKALVNDAVVNGATYDILENVSEKHLGADEKLIVATPGYYLREESSENVSNIPKFSQRLLKMMVRSATKMGALPLHYDLNDMDALNTQQYNDFVKMQRLFADFNNGNCMEMHYVTANSVSDIPSLQGAKMCYVNVVREPSRWFYFNKLGMLIATAACPYLLPVTVADWCFPKYETRVNFYVMDVKTGKMEIAESFSQDAPISRAYVDGFVYHELENYIKGK